MLPRRGIDLKVGSSSLLRADFCGAPRAAEMRDRSRGWEFEPAKCLFFADFIWSAAGCYSGSQIVISLKYADMIDRECPEM